MLALADRAELAQLASVDEQHHAGIPEPERREARQLLAERQAQLAAGDDRVDDDARPRVVFGEDRIGVRGERRSERIDPAGVDREPGGRAMAAEALELVSAGRERAVQVEAAGRAARALRSRDQHDRPAVALDEPRGDDADHTLVPVRSGDDVAATAPARVGPRFDLV